MVEKRLIEPEVTRAIECINQEKNFVITGGAGSGKTYSLISLINIFSQKNKSTPIVCITYTNNAVYEIRQRSNNKRLYVSTIHEFLWDLIRQFQKEIKDTLVELLNDKEQTLFKLPDKDNYIDRNYFEGQTINYDEYYHISKEQSSISHDQVIILAEEMFKKYKKLCDLFKDTAKLILIDEYQDTAPEVVRILLNHINKSNKICVVGFFGDSMQSIYDSGVGEIVDDDIEYIFKKQNRRNPISVINVGNKLRNDELIQEPSLDLNATNMENGKVLDGKALFLYSQKDENNKYQILEQAKKKNPLFETWNFEDEETKELWLTHKINAEKSGFPSLFNLYNKDPIKELINLLIKKSENMNITLEENMTFKELCENNLFIFENRNRGNLYLIACSEYKNELNLISSMNWSKVKNQVITKDSLLSYKYDGLSNSYKANYTRDIILRQLDDIYEIYNLFYRKDINILLKKIPYKMSSVSNKLELITILNNLTKKINSGDDIEDIVHYAFKNNIVYERKKFTSFIRGRGYYLWNRIKEISFLEYKKSIDYQKEVLPFATQHSVKGSEYDRVLVVLDNGNWYKYNFENLFLNRGKTEIKERTQKLLYVCITRAKREMFVYMELDLDSSNASIIIERAEEIFGKEHVIKI